MNYVKVNNQSDKLLSHLFKKSRYIKKKLKIEKFKLFKVLGSFKY